MFTRKWLVSTAERMLKTGAQTLIGVIGGDQLGWWSMGWSSGWAFVATTMVLSLLSSVISTPFGPDPQSPSAV